MFKLTLPIEPRPAAPKLGLVQSLCLLGKVLAIGSAFLLSPGSSLGNTASHTLFIKSDGSLWGMGKNISGQLGDGSTTNRSDPTEILASGVEAAAAGDGHSLILKTDGSLWAMGKNSSGQLGDGTINATSSPVQVVSSGVTAVAVGGYHSLFIKTDGSLWAMGRNTNGQLGDGSTTDQHTPVEILSSGVAAVAAGGYHSLIVKTDGSLWAMGSNQFGQLGDGSYADLSSPAQIIASGVETVASGWWHSLVLKTDGSLIAMGYNQSGQLGDGSTTTRNLPTEILASGVEAIAGGDAHTLVVKTDGSLWAMGANYFGQLGDGTNTERNASVQVLASGVKTATVGFRHSLIIKSDGSLWTTGYNGHGQLGDGGTTDRNTPAEILSSGVIKLSDRKPRPNNEPVITSDDGGATTSLSVAENQTAVTTVTATDADRDDLTFSISGGADQAAFSINAATGELTFVSSPNHESPTDAGNDNSYLVVVRASDWELHGEQTITVTVTNVDESPVVGNPLPEVSALEDDGDLSIDLSNVFHDVDDANDTIGKTVESSDPSLVAVSLDGDLLSLDFQPNQSGDATITVTGAASGKSVQDAFAVSVQAVDDAPVAVNLPADLVVAMDSTDTTIDLSNVFNDLDHDNALITMAVASSDESLVTASLSGNVLSLTYLPDQNGTAIITLTASSNGLTGSGSFSVQVIEVFRPGVETLTPGPLSGGKADLQGTLLDDGGVEILEMGFLASLQPDPETEGQETEVFLAGAMETNGSFAVQATGLRTGRTYYLRAFARNSEGISYGEQVKFELAADLETGVLAAAAELAGKPNWKESSWFGQFYQTDTSWVYHVELGWLYLFGEDPKDMWFWSSSLGWAWTGEGIYPYLYLSADDGWHLYMQKINDRFILYRYATNQWVDYEVKQ